MVIERVTISAPKDGRVSAEVSRGSRPRQSSRDSRWHILNLVTQRPVSSALFFTYSLNCVFWYLHIPSVAHCGPYVGASSLAQATSPEQFAMDLKPSFQQCSQPSRNAWNPTWLLVNKQKTLASLYGPCTATAEKDLGLKCSSAPRGLWLWPPRCQHLSRSSFQTMDQRKDARVWDAV